jgi:hypothetical protein
VQMAGRPVVQFSQVPQNTDRQVMTWSPFLTYLTSEPTWSTYTLPQRVFWDYAPKGFSRVHTPLCRASVVSRHGRL